MPKGRIPSSRLLLHLQAPAALLLAVASGKEDAVAEKWGRFTAPPLQALLPETRPEAISLLQVASARRAGDVHVAAGRRQANDRGPMVSLSQSRAILAHMEPPLDHDLAPAGAAVLWILGGLILVLASCILAKAFQKGEADCNVRDCHELFFSKGRGNRNRDTRQQPSGRPAEDVLAGAARPSIKTEGVNRLPVLCTELLSGSPTRFAIPAQPLIDPRFEMDILSYDASPLLSAARKNFDHGSEIWISLYGMSTAMAIVTEMQEVLLNDGQRVGGLTLTSSGKADKLASGALTTFTSPDGRVLLELIAEGHQLRLVSPARDGISAMVGRVTRKEALGGGSVSSVASASAPLVASREHYELVANPGVDAVLVTSIFLAFVVFGDASHGLLPMRSGGSF